MRRVVQSVTGVANGVTIPVTNESISFGIGFGVVVSGGAITYTVQHTFDDIYNPAITPTWFNNSTATGLSANQDGNYAFPVAAVRIIGTAGTGTATITMLFNGGQS
jgi:hypothetical protein